MYACIPVCIPMHASMIFIIDFYEIKMIKTPRDLIKMIKTNENGIFFGRYLLTFGKLRARLGVKKAGKLCFL